MSNKYNDQIIDILSDDIADFQAMVLRISEMMEETPEEVIRKLVNSKWDIRECLDYKDVVTVWEVENDKLYKRSL